MCDRYPLLPQDAGVPMVLITGVFQISLNLKSLQAPNLEAQHHLGIRPQREENNYGPKPCIIRTRMVRPNLEAGIKPL